MEELLHINAEADDRRWLPFGASAFTLPLGFRVTWVSIVTSVWTGARSTGATSGSVRISSEFSYADRG